MSHRPPAAEWAGQTVRWNALSGSPRRARGQAGSAVVLGVHDAAADHLAIGKIDEDVRCGVEDGHLVMSTGEQRIHQSAVGAAHVNRSRPCC